MWCQRSPPLLLIWLHPMITSPESEKLSTTTKIIWSLDFFVVSFCYYKYTECTLWVAAKLNPQISPQRVPDILYQIFCFQQAFWLNIRHSMSPFKNIYISRRIFLHWKLKNRVEIKKSVKIKNSRMKFFGFFFIFFGSNDMK